MRTAARCRIIHNTEIGAWVRDGDGDLLFLVISAGSRRRRPELAVQAGEPAAVELSGTAMRAATPSGARPSCGALAVAAYQPPSISRETAMSTDLPGRPGGLASPPGSSPTPARSRCGCHPTTTCSPRSSPASARCPRRPDPVGAQQDNRTEGGSSVCYSRIPVRGVLCLYGLRDGAGGWARGRRITGERRSP
jgi:hypothetical protein